jgi:signal transduction histidine kinase
LYEVLLHKVREASDEHPFLLADLPPSKRQIRVALVVVAVLLVAFGVVAPFTNIQLPRFDAFVTAVQTGFVIIDLITAALVFTQFFIVRWWALLALGCGFLFSALIAISYALTFPGLLAPTGLLGAGLQSAVWLYIFWHVGLALAVIVYVVLKNADSSARYPGTAIGWAVTAIIAMVFGLTWVAIAGDGVLPAIYLDNVRVDRGLSARTIGELEVLLCAAAVVVLWFRWHSMLDLWLMVMCWTWLLEVTISATLNYQRFSLGWYAGRTYWLIGSIFVLLILLSETTRLYADLARSATRQRHKRVARQVAMDTMAASIAHEIKQPLAAIVTTGRAGMNWLARATPDLDEARVAFKSIVDSGNRASEVIDGVRSMFKKDNHGRASLSANDVIQEALRMADVDLRAQRISVSAELREGLPRLLGDRGQLQQVFLNLIINATEAMRPITDRARLLRVTSDINRESSEVLVTIEVSGTGIDKKEKDRIFEPFFTTKSTGTGIGLTICRSIIESHSGSLRASANNPYGTIFHVALPSGGE